MKRRKGFTLIELIVVILILSILAVLVAPKLLGYTDTAKIAGAKTDIKQYHSMLEQFRLKCGRYPTTQEGLEALHTQPANVKDWQQFLDGPVHPDPWNNPYDYEYPGPGGEDSYVLQSYGADGAPGGDGINADIVDGQF